MKPFHHHFVPHHHANAFNAEELFQHRAHLISIRALFVYLQVLFFGGLLFFSIRIGAPQVLGTVTFPPSEIIRLTNIKRNENGLPSLAENQNLDRAAEAKARDMFANDYWAHYSPQGKTPWNFITGAGYRYVFAGENLARDFDSAGAVVSAWMNSPSHKSNLLDRNFRDIGVAVASGKLSGREGILVVQEFGSTTSVPVTKQVSEQTPVNVKTAEEPQVAGRQDSLLSVPVPSNFALTKYSTFGLIAFMFVLFMVELAVTLKKANLSLQPAVIAHIILLGFVLVALWYSASGALI